MPIIKSAKKRVRVATKAAVRNSKTKRALKAALKIFGRKQDTTSHSSAQSALDKAVKKGIVHKNKAARVKKQLATKAKAATSKPVTKKAAPKAKKVTKPAKVTTAKKTAAKKK